MRAVSVLSFAALAMFVFAAPVVSNLSTGAQDAAY
jgi:hypothetical protein